MNSIDIRVEWHSPDSIWAAVFVRDGEPWYLDGALVGTATTTPGSVQELFDLAKHLVKFGENFLTDGEISLEDRIWLFKLIDMTGESEEELYTAIRSANGGKDPYTR